MNDIYREEEIQRECVRDRGDIQIDGDTDRGALYR